MADTTESKEDGGSKSGGAFAIIDKLFEIRWVARAVSAVLFAETAMMLSKGKNFMTFDWEHANWSADTGHLVFTVAALGLMVSTVLTFVQGLIIYCFRLVRRLLVDDRFEGWPGFVESEKLKEKADREQSSYLNTKWKEEVDKAMNYRETVEKIGTSAFQFLVMFGLNQLLVSNVASSVQFSLNSAYRIPLLAFLWIACGFMAILCLVAWWREDNPKIWIKDLELYDELKALEKEKHEKLFGSAMHVPSSAPLHSAHIPPPPIARSTAPLPQR